MGHCWSALTTSMRGVFNRSQQLVWHLCGQQSSGGCTSFGAVCLLIFCCPCCCCFLIHKCIRYFRADSSQQRRASQSAPNHEQYQPIVGDNYDRNETYSSLSTEGDVEAAVPSNQEKTPQPEPRVPESKKNINNFLFYTNQIKSKPNGDLIDVIHKKWWNDYALLERHHGFIQWLFPLPEPGVNPEAQVLYPEEIELIKSDKGASERLLTSYKMMLGFYGFELIDESTGQLRRADNFVARFANLNRNGHNNLRISRILRSLGLLGYDHLKYHMVYQFLREIIVENTLPNCRQSCMSFWIHTLSDDDQDEIEVAITQLHDEVAENKRRNCDDGFRPSHKAAPATTTTNYQLEDEVWNNKQLSSDGGSRLSDVVTTAATTTNYQPDEEVWNNKQLSSDGDSKPSDVVATTTSCHQRPAEREGDAGGDAAVEQVANVETSPASTEAEINDSAAEKQVGDVNTSPAGGGEFIKTFAKPVDAERETKAGPTEVLHQDEIGNIAGDEPETQVSQQLLMNTGDETQE